MKNFTKILLVSFCLAAVISASGQEIRHGTPMVIPEKWSTDVVISNNATQDQHSVDLAVAFNGWLYSIYTINTPSLGGYEIRVSKDDGITWNLFRNYTDANRLYMDAHIMVTGSDTNSLRIIFVVTYQNTATSKYGIYLDLKDKDNVHIGEPIFEETSSIIVDASIANDSEDPAWNTAPYGIALVYAKSGAAADTLNFYCSLDGGATVGNTQTYVTGGFIKNVSLSYGISLNRNNGRYFFTWTEMDNSGDKMGNLFMNYNASTVDGPLATRICIDSAYSGATNYCASPSICVQQNSSVNNDSADLTALILFERYWGGTSDADVIGLFNHEVLNNPGAWALTILDNWGTTQCKQPHVSYDRFYNNYLATYQDSTNQALIFTVKPLNLPTPGSWPPLNAQYNDASNIVNPHPVVRINHIYHQCAFVWVAEGGPNDIAMFDAEYAIDLSAIDEITSSGLISIYPNPANNIVNMILDVKVSEKIRVEMFDIMGRSVAVLLDENCSEGSHQFTYDVSKIQAGQYICRIITSEKVSTKPLQIIH